MRKPIFPISIGELLVRDDLYDIHVFITGKVNEKNYDIHLFYELLLYIKINVIENGFLIYSPNKLDLYKFFFIYRKLWNDQKHCQEISKENLLLI